MGCIVCNFSTNWGSAPNKQIYEKGKNIYVGEKKQNKTKNSSWVLWVTFNSASLPIISYARIKNALKDNRNTMVWWQICN